jgi:hypothetical protein
LSRGQDWLSPPSPTLLSGLKLLLPHRTQGSDGGERVHPVWGRRSLERIEHHPAVGPDLIGVLLALLLLAFSNRSCSNRSPYRSTHSAGTWARTHAGATSESTFNTETIDTPHAQGAVEGTDLGQDMGRVSSLLPMSGSATHLPDIAPRADPTDAVRQDPARGASDIRRAR